MNKGQCNSFSGYTVLKSGASTGAPQHIHVPLPILILMPVCSCNIRRVGGNGGVCEAYC